MDQAGSGGWWLAADGQWYPPPAFPTPRTQASPRSRALITGGLTAGIAVALLALAALLSTSTAPPPAVPALPSNPGRALLTRAIQNARAQGWVHLVLSTTQGTTAVVVTEDAGPSEGQQTVTIGSQSATEIFLHNVAYVRVDSLALAKALGVSSLGSNAVGQWVTFTSSDHGYGALAKGMDIQEAVGQSLAFSGPLTVGSPTTVDGQAVTPLTGSVPGSNGHQIKGTIDVTRTASPLPVELNASSPSLSATVIFSQWGHVVPLSAPSGSRPPSSF